MWIYFCSQPPQFVEKNHLASRNRVESHVNLVRSFFSFEIHKNIEKWEFFSYFSRNQGWNCSFSQSGKKSKQANDENMQKYIRKQYNDSNKDEEDEKEKYLNGLLPRVRISEN